MGLGRRFAIAGASALAGLALAEIGLRLALRLGGEPYSAWKTRAALERGVATMRERAPAPGGGDPPGADEDPGKRHVVHPYWGYEPAAGLRQLAADLSWFAGGDGAHSFDVLVLGGSVAAIFAEQGYPVLARSLASRAGDSLGPARLMCYARGGFKAPQQATVLATLLACGVEPDLVIVIDGFNEVAIAAQNSASGAHPLYPSIAQWGPVASGGFTDRELLDELVAVRQAELAASEWSARAIRWRWHWSALLGRFARARFAALQADWAEAQNRSVACLTRLGVADAITGPPFEPRRGDAGQEPGALARAVALSVAAWSATAENVRAMCDARGIACVQALQPTLHDVGSKPLTDAERAAGTATQSWIDGVTLGYPLLREAAAGLGARGVPLLDCTQLFATVAEPLYGDACHFDERGNALLAAALAPAVERALAER
jgi:hypothetical protein